jgi:hypothetical protein
LSIFNPDKSRPEYTKITRKDSRLYVNYNGWTYDLSPSPITRMNLPPDVSGVDEILLRGSEAKGIVGDFELRTEYEWYRGCDARAELLKVFMDGWIYEIFGEGLKFEKMLVWACPYLKMVLGSNPKSIYLSAEPVCSRIQSKY